MLPLFYCLTQARRVRHQTASKAGLCWERALRHSLGHALAGRAYQQVHTPSANKNETYTLTPSPPVGDRSAVHTTGALLTHSQLQKKSTLIPTNLSRNMVCSAKGIRKFHKKLSLTFSGNTSFGSGYMWNTPFSDKEIYQ